jgi:hypothetical protein
MEAGDERHEVRRGRGAWCVSRFTAGGDEGDYHACLSDQGLVEAGWFWDGGELPASVPAPAPDRGARVEKAERPVAAHEAEVASSTAEASG